MSEKKLYDLTGFDEAKAAIAKSVFDSVMNRLRQTRPSLVKTFETEKLFLITLYDEDYGKLREWRAIYQPYAEVVDIVEIQHPQAGPVTGLVMLPKPGLTVRQVMEVRTGKKLPDDFK